SYSSASPRRPPSLPTRRSSDLDARANARAVRRGRAGCLPPLRGGSLRCSQHRLARRNSLRSLRELRSDTRRENDERCALRAPPVLLRFSAAHEARPRRTARPFARAFAGTVVAFAGTGPVVASNTTNPGIAAVGGASGRRTGAAPGVCGARALGRSGRFRRRRAAPPRGRRAQRASYF